jgi:hypothetical protein
MGDVAKERSTGVNRISGPDENNIANVSDNKEISIRDTHDFGGLDTILNLTTTPIEGKVGANPKALRKYVVMEALSTNVVWGFTNSTQSFDLFKSQLIMIPVGPATQIWYKVTSATGQVAFGEIS